MTNLLNTSLGNVNAGQSASPNFNIPYICPPNTPPELVPYLQPIYSAFQNLIQTLILNAGIASRSASQLLSSDDDPTSVLVGNVHRFYCQPLEPINFGAAITLVNQGGFLFARNASAKDNTRPPHGFCSTVGGLNNAVGEVQIAEGVISNFTSSVITVGALYYLGNTPGTYQTTPGSVSYPVAFGLTTTSLYFRYFNGLS